MEFFYDIMKKINFLGTSTELNVGKILCLGKNYAEHAKEMMSDVPTVPIVFMKPSTAIIGGSDKIIIPKISKEVHHEVELVVVVGQDAKNILAKDAYNYIAGYAVGLDMTLRDVQSDAKKKGNPWTVAKGFDTSAPISEVIPKAQIKNPHDLIIICKVNGALRQKSSTGKMIFSIDKIIEYISSIFTLEEGDLIFTGTPEGVGQVKAGDIIEAELEGYIKISHQVIAA
jgi:2-keto-4-pentenoate hydratase/2-oxohepta-3-ene-1,7-dioic acid hydratase in catechol pathway